MRGRQRPEVSWRTWCRWWDSDGYVSVDIWDIRRGIREAEQEMARHYARHIRAQAERARDEKRLKELLVILGAK